MMKKTLFLLLTVLLGMLLLAPALAQPAYEVLLPQDYAQSARCYPAAYVMPQDGYTADDSGIAEKLMKAALEGAGTDMIIVLPVFTADEDPVSAAAQIVEAVDAAYRTIPSAQYRALLGTGAGGYLAYVTALKLPETFGAAASIRGNFAGEENPWLNTYGSVYDMIELLQLQDAAALERLYTYMDAPVDDAWTNMTGSTNDLGALFIGFGTGSASHEYTVRPGAYGGEFLAESVGRVANRLTERMLSGAASGVVSLERSALTAETTHVGVQYEITFTEAFAGFAPQGVAAEAIVSVVDPATGDVLFEVSEAISAGSGSVSGTLAAENRVNGTSSDVKLSVRMLGTTIPLASATLIRVEEPVIDGDDQRISLMGDWHFQYTGMKTLDVAALTQDEYAAWPVVQPGLTSWVKGFGNISDENVTSGYGPDYFNYFITGSGYYAKTFTVPQEFDAQEVLLSIGYVDDRCEVFLNGVRVGATGMDENGQPTGETTWAVYSCFDIDPALLVRGGENTVVVRAWNDLPFGAGGWYGGPTALYSRAAFDREHGGAQSERFFEETFESAHAAAGLGKKGTVENKHLIYLPEDYFTSGRRYPTVYLLHQFNSDHTSYRGDRVNELLDAGVRAGLFDEMIVVIPNSSEESWWTGAWEKMITDELIPLIDGKYRTIRDARYRLTAGCSMGGQGAMAVALRNPDAFTGAVSFFGAFSYGGTSSPNAIAQSESAAYMDYFTLYFICGNQDSYGFGVPAIALNQQLEQLGVKHGFFIENGGHDSSFYVPYFDDAFAYVRKNMYQSDEHVLDLFEGSVTVEGTKVTAVLEAKDGIEAYVHTVPASSYTLCETAPLSVPLTLEISQDGHVVYTHEVNDLTFAGAASKTIEADVSAYVDAKKPFGVTLRASVFDLMKTLAEIK